MSPIFTKVSKTIAHLSPIARPMSLLSVALLSSSALSACGDFEIAGPANHFVSDSHDNDQIKLFDNAPLVGQYLSGSSVTFTIERTGEQEGEQSSLENLIIESSDPTLLKISEGVENCLDTHFCESLEVGLGDRSRSQRFDVLGGGEVTLTFKDGDQVILSREVKLLEADSLKVSRDIPEVLDLGSVAGEGEKVISGSEFELRLRAMVQSESGEEEIDISRLTKLPSSEGFELKQSDPFGMGLTLHITPESEGELSVPVTVGTQSVEMNFNVVSATEIAGLSVNHGLILNAGGNNNEQSSEENTAPNAMAVAVAKDASGAPIFGAQVTWEQLSSEGDDAEVVNTLEGSQLNFVHDESNSVAFRVTIGEFSEIVLLPANADLLGNISTSDAFADGCDARGDVSGSILIALLLMSMVAVRRRAVS